MEIGYAAGAGVPIFATRAPSDLTLREYVTVVPTLAEALRRVETSSRPRRPQGILIDPHASVEEAHDILERIEVALTCQTGFGEPAHRVHRELADLRTTLAMPSYVQ
jgi:hypothetical protein